MRTTIATLTLALLSTAGANAAFANGQGTPVEPAPMPAPTVLQPAGPEPMAPAPAPMVDTWSGFYVGLSAGYADADITATDQTPGQGGFYTPLGAPGTYGFDFSDSGFAGGAHIGAQKQFGQFVLGAEASWIYTDISQTITSPYFPDSDQETGEIESYATAVARLGYAFDNVLIYAKGGYAGGKVKFTARDNDALTTYSYDDWQSGYALGAGVDYALSNDLTLGIDYTYIDLGTGEGTGPNVFDDGSLGANTNTYEVDASSCMASRLSYKFAGL